MDRLTALSLTHRGVTIALLAAITAGLAAGLPRLRTDVGYRAFLGDDHPAVRELDAFIERFDAGLPLLAVWSCAQAPCASALDPAALEMAGAVERALADAPGVRRVRSPASQPLLAPGPAGPVPRRLVEGGRPAPDRARLAALALKDPLLAGSLVSSDGVVGAIAVELASSESEDNVGAYRALRDALAPFEARGFVFHFAGGPVEFVVAAGELEADSARLVPAMVALIAVVLLALLRSWAATLAALLTVGLAVLWTFGALGWLGFARNSLTEALAPLVLVIGVCDAIHVLTRAAATRPGAGPETRPAALVRAAGEVGAACAMTTFTTAAGFLSFATSGLRSFVEFGLIAGFGVTAAFVLTFTWMPIAAVVVRAEPRAARRTTRGFERALAAVFDRVARRRRVVLAAAALLSAATALGVARLTVDASFEDLYGEKSRVVRWAHFVAERLRKPDTLELELVPPPGTDTLAPGTLAVVERLVAALDRIEGLGRPHSLLDLLDRARELASAGSPALAPPVEGAVRNAVLIERLSAAGTGAVERLRSSDGRLRVWIEADKPPQDELREILGRVREALDETLPAGWSHTVTGPLSVVHDMIEEIRRTQITSFATAALVVLALVAVFLRSAVWALLAMIPTLLPVWITLGAMGLAGVRLDVGTAMVAAVVLGLAVDDAIHLLFQYRRRRLAGAPAPEAVRDAFLHVGRALCTTSFALALGFLVLLLSSWGTIAGFGLVSAIAILVALAATLIVLPALIVQVAALRREAR